MQKKILLLFLSCFFMTSSILFAQSKRNDIPANKLPKAVQEVLVQYVSILLNASDLDDCADKFLSVAGGSLVNEDALSLRNTIKPYSLKKDFNNVKFYANPIKITRVNASPSNGTGYGESAIKGMVYKIWIAKKDGQAGMPAPISIMVPEGHPTIKTPKVIGIGSL